MEVYAECDESLHEHCLSCISLNCTGNPLGCIVIPCPNFPCGSRLHACKLEDHFLICLYQKCQCINAQYGCQVWLQRRQLTEHLEHCVASVVVCSATWNRYLVNHTALDRMEQLCSNQDSGGVSLDDSFSKEYRATFQKTVEIHDMVADLAFALKDQRKVFESKRITQKFGKRVWRCNKFEYNPAVPIQTWRDCQSDDATLIVSSRDGDNDSECDDDNDDDVLSSRRKSIPAVALECALCHIDPTSQHLHVLGSYITGDESIFFAKKKRVHRPPLPVFYVEHGLLLRSNHDIISHQQLKPRNVYTFRCDCKMRRDSFMWHQINVHNEIMPGIDGKLVLRCPMKLYGCDAYAIQYRPFNKQWRVVFNSVLDTFVITCEAEHAHTDSSYEGFANLPWPILVDICTYLDCASLWCLSLTCQRLRAACASQLGFCGYVDQTWLRTVAVDGRIQWIAGNQVWSFSKTCEPIRQWHFEPDFTLGPHVQCCNRYDPVKHVRPFRIVSSLRENKEGAEKTHTVEE